MGNENPVVGAYGKPQQVSEPQIAGDQDGFLLPGERENRFVFPTAESVSRMS